MRNTVAVTFAVAALLGTPSLFSGTARAEPVTVATNQVMLTAGSKTTTITADRIVLRDKGYALYGNFRIVGPSGRGYQGKDAEMTVAEDPSGKMLLVTTRNPLTRTEPVQGSDGKMLTKQVVVNEPGQWVGGMLYLNPKTVYANTPKSGK
jgi:hypothetical protein